MRFVPAALAPSLALIMVTVAAPPAGAQYYCPMAEGDRWEYGVEVIPLYFDAQTRFWGDPTASQIAAALSFQLNQVFEASNAKIRVAYAGERRDLGPTEFIDGAIVLRADFWRRNDVVADDSNGNGRIDRCQVFVAPGIQGNAAWHVQAQILNCLGIDSPRTCGVPDQPALTALDASTVYRAYDIDALEYAYGTELDPVVGFSMSSTGTGWAPISGLPSSMTGARGPLSACNSYHFATRRRLAWSFITLVMEWSQLLSEPDHLAGATSLTPPAVACGPDADQALIGWVDQFPGTAPIAHKWVVRTGDSEVQSEQVLGANASDQLRATFDPATGDYVMVHRDGTTRSTVVSVVGGTEVLLSEAGEPIRAPSAPSIACGDPSITGPENCMVAWVVAGWGARLGWVQGHVEGGAFVYDDADIRHSPFYIQGSPAIAATGDTTSPWLLGYQANEFSLYVRRKTATGTSWSLSHAEHFPIGTQVSSPTIASHFFVSCSFACWFRQEFEIFAKLSTLQ